MNLHLQWLRSLSLDFLGITSRELCRELVNKKLREKEKGKSKRQMAEQPLPALLVLTPAYLYVPGAQGERSIGQILL